MVVALMYADPTKLKEQIEALALEKGVVLELRGDIGWALYPNIQLIAESATLSYVDASMKLDAEIDHFNFSLRAWPALRGELQFVGLEVEGAEAGLEFLETVDADDQTDLFQNLRQASALLPKTSIDYLRLAEVNIGVVRQDEAAQQVNLHHLLAENVVTDGGPFAVEVELDITSFPDGFEHVVAEGYLVIDPFTEIYSVDFRDLSIGGEVNKTQGVMQGFVRMSLDGSRNQWSWEIDLAESGRAGLSGSFLGSVSPVKGAGRLESNISDLPTWIALAGYQDVGVSMPVNMLALDAELHLDSNTIELANARLRIDGNSARGNAHYRWGDDELISAHINFQQLDLQPYFPREEEGEDLPAGSGQAAIPAELLSLLRSKDLAIQVYAEQLYLPDQQLSDLDLTTEFEGGLGQLKLSAAEVAEGELSLLMTTDLANGEEALIQADFSGLQLGKLTPGQASAMSVQGGLDLSYQGILEDLSRTPLVQGLQGSGQIRVTDLAIPSMNIEQTLCESAELLGATPAVATDWTTGTQLGDFDANYLVQNGVARIEAFEFGYGNMAVLGAANLRLDTLAYDMRFEVEVDGTKTSEQGCHLNKYAQGIQLPLQCSGAIDAGAEMSCGIDASIAERLVLQQVGGRLIESVLGRLGGEQTDQSGAENDLNQGQAAGESDQTRRNELRAILEGMLKDIDN
eukprot:g4258.t1